MTEQWDASTGIDEFAGRFGQPHLHLLLHAAFPLVLNPDMLYHIWANFQRDCQGKPLQIPWYAVADVLLSPLCHEIAFETYAMAEGVRDGLLARLFADPRFLHDGHGRFQELSEFLRQYVAKDLESPRRSQKEWAEAQRWTAFAYVEPQRLVESISEAYQSVDEADRSQHLRLANLLQTFDVSLSTWAQPPDDVAAQFQALKSYSQGWTSYVRSEEERAEAHFRAYTEQRADSQALPLPAPIAEKIANRAVDVPVESEAPRKRSTRLEGLQRAGQRRDERDRWATIVDDIGAGRCLPILGRWLGLESGLSALPEVAAEISKRPFGAWLSQAWAEDVGYPFARDAQLEEIAQYLAVERGKHASVDRFLRFIKSRLIWAGLDNPQTVKSAEMLSDEELWQLSVAQVVRELDLPGGYETVATLPLPIYVTTSPFTLLEAALQGEGKDPRTQLYVAEGQELSLEPEHQVDPAFRATVGQPLVYHIWGLESYPTSMLLSRDDHLRFVKDNSRNPEALPIEVRSALASSGWLMAGHEPEDLPFRTLFHTLSRHSLSRLQRTNVIQLRRPDSEGSTAMVERYFANYNAQLYWGDPASFFAQLWEAYQPASRK